MRNKLILPLLAATIMTPASAAAQSPDVAALREQIAAMQAEITRLAAEVEQLEAQNAQQPAVIAAAVAEAQKEAEPATTIAWKGAPEFESEGGWSFKPRGRLQIDAGVLDGPAGLNDGSTGFGSEIRRAYLGFDGKIPGGFTYRAEIDVAGSSVEITDLYLTYKASDAVSITVGQFKPYWGLEETTSDLFTSFTERAPINTAFGFERRLGLGANYSQGPLLLQAGIFTDNVADLNNDENNALSYDGRIVLAPKLAGGILHLGASAHIRDLNDSATTVRYRTRPFIHTPDIRFVDTGNIAAVGENGYGLEAAYLRGPFHVAGEYRWQDVRRGLASNATFDGYYVEAGMFLTGGDTRGYRSGSFDRTRPKRPLGNGGMGALELNVRYDTLDLNSGAIRGGVQDGYSAALVWIPTDFTRFILNYGHLEYSEAFIPLLNGSRSYSADTFGIRAQFDF